jgi:hypothetical protein
MPRSSNRDCDDGLQYLLPVNRLASNAYFSRRESINSAKQNKNPTATAPPSTSGQLKLSVSGTGTPPTIAKLIFMQFFLPESLPDRKS